MNPHDRDSNPAKIHGAWFQDLMNLRFLCLIIERIQWETQTKIRGGFVQIQKEIYPRVWAITEGDCGSHEMWYG